MTALSLWARIEIARIKAGPRAELWDGLEDDAIAFVLESLRAYAGKSHDHDPIDVYGAALMLYELGSLRLRWRDQSSPIADIEECDVGENAKHRPIWDGQGVRWPTSQKAAAARRL